MMKSLSVARGLSNVRYAGLTALTSESSPSCGPMFQPCPCTWGNLKPISISPLLSYRHWRGTLLLSTSVRSPCSFCSSNLRLHGFKGTGGERKGSEASGSCASATGLRGEPDQATHGWCKPSKPSRHPSLPFLFPHHFQDLSGPSEWLVGALRAAQSGPELVALRSQAPAVLLPQQRILGFRV